MQNLLKDSPLGCISSDGLQYLSGKLRTLLQRMHTSKLNHIRKALHMPQAIERSILRASPYCFINHSKPFLLHQDFISHKDWFEVREIRRSGDSHHFII
jgi:hypothetical protein